MSKPTRRLRVVPTLEAQWSMFYEQVLSRFKLPDALIHQYRVTFYTGAGSLLKILSSNAGEAATQGVIREVHEFHARIARDQQTRGQTALDPAGPSTPEGPVS